MLKTNTSNNGQSKIYLARHGESEANVARYLAGSRNAALTEKGVQQAYDLAENILSSGVKIEKIISSPLARALGTAAIVASVLRIDPSEITIVPNLAERSGGAYEGGPISDFYDASDREIEDAGGETFDALAKRVRQASEHVRELAGDESTLVVGHAEFGRMAIALASHLAPAAMMELEKPENGKIQNFPEVPEEAKTRLFAGTVLEGSRPDAWGVALSINDGKDTAVAPWRGLREVLGADQLDPKTWIMPTKSNVKGRHRLKLKPGDEVLVDVDLRGDSMENTFVKV